MEDLRKDTNIVVVCLIRNSENKYLMIRPSSYKDFGEYQDAWYPPTGHVKKGEMVSEALVRELKEELGVKIRPVRLISEWKQDIPGEKAYWWECEIIDGEIIKGDEIAKYGYFSAKELKGLKLWPAETKFFEKFFWN